MHDQSKPPGTFDRSHLARLQSLRKNRASRDRENSFVVEGIRQFVRVCDERFEIDTVFVSPILLRQGLAQKLVRRLAASGVRKIELSSEQFRSISTTERASGVAAIVRQRWTTPNDLDPSRGVGWIVIDSLRSAGNLGTIFRTAEAVGMGGVIFAGDACDPFNPHVVRASMGGIFHLPLVRTTPRELGFWLARHQIDLIGLSADASRLWTALPSHKRHAIALGDERDGLSPALRRICDDQVRLPMTGHADSLNVAVAAGVMMYELVRLAGQK